MKRTILLNILKTFCEVRAREEWVVLRIEALVPNLAGTSSERICVIWELSHAPQKQAVLCVLAGAELMRVMLMRGWVLN